jgi:uncharacterized repeat protein (TIGR03803 family)
MPHLNEIHMVATGWCQFSHRVLGGITTGVCGIGANSPPGCGVVFKIDVNGEETVLHSFTGGGDGWWLNPGLALDAAGDLYGTTQLGGTSSCGCGVVFKMDPPGHETEFARSRHNERLRNHAPSAIGPWLTSVWEMSYHASLPKPTNQVC